MDVFCQKLPKIELHAHLNGSLSSSTLKRLGVPEESLSKYQTTHTDIEQVFDLFKIAHQATSTSANLYLATKSVIEDFAEDNVIYLELRTTPRSEETMSEIDYIETVIRATSDIESSKIMVKLIFSLDRKLPFNKQAETLELIIKYHYMYPDLIKGLDLSGDPSKGQFFKEFFERARKNGLYTAIHCAEVPNIDETRKIVDFKPDRIGHGTHLHPIYGGSPDTWAKYKEMKIPIECCMTSNVVVSTVKSYAEHHVQHWMKECLPFSLCTDDKGVFKTTLSKEFLHAHETFRLSKLDLWTISKTSVDHSFANSKEKEFLHLAMEQWKNKNL